MSSFDERLEEELEKLEKKKKKKKPNDLVTSGPLGYLPSSGSDNPYSIYTGSRDDDDDIAPIRTVGTLSKDDEKKEDRIDFFQKGAFDDGYQFGDVTKSILGTAGDAGLNIAKGLAGLGEGLGDLIAYGVAGVADKFGADDYAAGVRKAAQVSLVDKATKGAEDYLNKYSILGRTSDAVMQGIGQIGGIIGTGGAAAGAGLGTAGVTAVTTGTMGLSGMGSGMGEAYRGGATDEEAALYGAISGAADALSELIFGGLGKAVHATGLSVGLISADDILAKKVSSLFSSQIMKNIASFGIKAGAEGVEEVVAGIAQAIGKNMTYMSEEDFGKILKDENLLEQFVVGAVASGFAQGPSLHIANKSGSDFITGQTQNEQAVIKKEIENRVAEAEKDGKKLTAKEKAKIEAQVEADMEKGYIATDTIEEVLGGEIYQRYKKAIDSENALLDQQKAVQEEFDKLNKMKQSEMTGEQIDRRVELKEELAELKETILSTQNHSLKSLLKQQLGEKVSEMVRSDRLIESYNERSRKGQAFEADLTKYDVKQRAVIEKAVKSGILNNTNRTHEFVDMVAKISADKGVLFDFTNNAKLKESGFAVDGKTVNGYVTKDGITVNVQSAKALNSIVGHEITHVLEGTELYTELQKALFDYAKPKGEYLPRYNSIKELYKNVYTDLSAEEFDAEINKEVTADLIGDLLFTDSDFIKNLSTSHRNVFQKMYDEVKYLLKVVTAGSKEAKELEKVKRAFEKAYRESGDTQSEDASDTKYSIVEDQKTIDFLENQEHITTYKAMVLIDGKLYPPMASQSRVEEEYTDKKGNKKTKTVRKLKNPSILGQWQQADERPDLAEKSFNPKRGYSSFDLLKSNGKTVPAAYNPYEHTSNIVLNDQFEEAYNRPELVTVEYEIPVSELSSGYKAEYAKDAVGQHSWKSGPVAKDLKDPRQVYLTRWSKPVRIVPDSEVASKYKEILDGTGLSVPFNVVTPSLLAELEKAGVAIDYEGSPMYKSIQKRAAEKTAYSLSAEQKEYFKDSVVRDDNGNLKVMYHGTSKGGFNVFDTYGSNYGLFGTGSYFTDSKTIGESYTKKGKGKNPQVYEAYLNIKNPMDMDAAADPAEWSKAFPEADFPQSGTNEQFYRAVEEFYADQWMPKWEVAEEIQAGIESNMGYDGITHIGGGRVNANGERHQVYIAFQPEQIKNIDNRKPTSSADIRYSLSEDSEGKRLTQEQEDYFKKSKMRDDAGNLKPMYHGTIHGGFHTFDPSYSDDSTSFFFVDNIDVAASYSDTYETYEAKAFKTPEDYDKFFKRIGKSEYFVEQKDGKYILLADEGPAYYTVAESENIEELYEAFCDYEGVGFGDVNYKVYLNLENPLEIDADGREWNALPAVNKESEQYEYIKVVEVGDGLNEVTIEYAKAGDPSPVTETVDLYKKFHYGLADTLANMAPGESLEGAYANPSTTREYAQYAKENGYDGVIFKNIYDIGGYGGASHKATVAIAFDSNQIKSVANEKPTPAADIRYSISEVTDAQNENGLDAGREVQFSLAHDTAYMDKAIAKNDSSLLVDRNTMNAAKVMREKIAARMNSIKDRGLVALPEDIEGNTYIANSSYDGTEENTTICPRSLASEAFVDAVSEYLGRPLTVDEQIYISQDLQGRSLTPECTYCYVATDRKAYRAFLGDYVAQRDAVLQQVADNPTADTSRSGELYKSFLNGRKDTNPMYSRFKMWVDAYKNGRPMIDASHLANINKLMGDINSEFGAELKPQIVDAMKYAQSASWAKKRINYVAYNGHILNWKQDRINKLNSHYGLRMYSFSDFHPAFVLENMQMITDASVRGLKMLGYTKDIDFVDIFAPSGMNINVSTFGFESGGNVYENNLIGAEWEKAKALREQYPNVGVTFVATNDTLVEWALDQDWIDVVIPYHLVRTGAEVAKAFGYTNYTSESSDTKTKEWTKADKKYIAPTEHNNDKATYLAALKKNHLNPRFERFIENPNYMKLVNECRQPASKSKPVQPVFNEEAAMVALAKLEANGYYQPIGGSVERMYEIAAEVAEDMTSRIAPDYSLSNVGEQQYEYGNYNVYGKDIALETTEESSDIAPVAENATTTPATVSREEMVEMFPDEPTPQTELNNLLQEKDALEGRMIDMANRGDFSEFDAVNERYIQLTGRLAELEGEVSESESDRLDSIGDEDAPPEMDAPYFEDSEPAQPENPMADRNIEDVGNRKVNAYMYEHPEVKPFFQAEARVMLGDLGETVRGEKIYNEQAYYNSGGEDGWTGTKRQTTADIADLLDNYGYTYAQIEKGLNAIIEDNGKENNAVSKRIEFALNDRLRNGYTNVWGEQMPPDQNYIRLLNENEITEYSRESFDAFMADADQYVPVEDDIAPVAAPAVKTMAEIAPVREAHLTITPKRKKAQRMVRADKPIDQKVANVLVTEPKVEKKKSSLWSMVKENVLDNGMVFEDLALKTKNRNLQAKWNFIRYAQSMGQRMVGKGADGVKSLDSIRQEVEKSGKTQQFYEYLYHWLNVDRMTLATRYNDTPNKAVFGDSVTADMSRATAVQLGQENPEFQRWAQDVYIYNSHLRNMMVNNGVISQETADLWQEMYPHYVPIRRADATGLNIDVPLDTRRTGVNAPVKRATGGNSDILPLFDTMAQRTMQTYKAIAKNSFGVELKNTLGTTIAREQSDVDGVIDSMDQHEELLQEGKKGRKPTFTVFENGEKVTFEITDEMYNAMKPASELMSYTNPVANTVSNVHRGLLTEYNPVFMATNAIKDTQDILINSQHPVRTYANLPRATLEIARNGKWFREYMDHGGEDNTYFDGESNSFDTEEKGVRKLLGIPPLSWISKANNFIERTPRLAEYIASRESGRSIEVSMLDAARVTTNFAAGGKLTKFANRNGATFLNASVQGVVQQARNFREAKANGLKGWAQLAGKFALAGLPALILNNIMWDDDDEYEELSDYVKQNYYIVGKFGDGKFVRIPKGRTLAVIQNAFEQVSNAITGDDEVDLKSFVELVISNLAPNNPVEDNILAPIIQVANNKTWYGEDLVPTRLQDLPAAEQYDESTDAISKWLGEKLNFSPYKINYLLDQYSGGVGDTILPMLTPEAESGDNTFMGNVLAPAKSKFTTDSVMNNQNVSDFYDLKDELTVKANSSKATDKDKLMAKYLNSVNSELSDLYAQKREIQSSNHPSDVKYRKVRDIQQQIVDLMKEGMSTYQNVTYEGEYARIGDRLYTKNDEGEWQKLSAEQVTKYEVTRAAGDALYATDGTNHYRWYEPGEDAGEGAEPGWRKVTEKELERQNEVTSGLGITPEEYWAKREEYSYAYDNPENYAVAKVVGGYDSYKQYSSDLYDIKADKDEYGKSISGSRKEKVLAYIDSLDADYYTKLILYKSEYTSYDDENYEIIEYLNGRDDISFEEEIAILRKLGFDVTANGDISW